MATENAYDVVVIGSGTGGYVAAIRAAQLGLRTAVVERAPTLGGTCLNWGCIPTKALLEHAHALKVAQEWKDWGLTIGQAAIGLDMGQVQARKDKIVKGLTGGIELLFKKNKIDWIKGSGRLAGKGKVEITEGQAQMLVRRRAKSSSPPVRSRAAFPGIEIDRKRIITSDEAIGLKEIPKSIVILGSGAVGVEFASIFRRFGSEVTIVELLPRLVPVEDEAVSAELEKSFKRQGIKVLTGTKVSGAKAGAGRRRDRGANARRDRAAARRRIPARRDRPRSGHRRASAPRKPGCGSSAATSTSTRASRPAWLASPPSATSSRSTQPGHPQLAHLSSAEGVALAERIAGAGVPADQLRPGARLHLLRSGDRQRRPDRARGARARLRRPHRHVQVRRAGPRPHRQRDRRIRQDRRRQEIRRDPRRPHDRAARDRARRRGDARRCGSNARSRS